MADFLTVREWVALYTDAKPPFPPHVLCTQINFLPIIERHMVRAWLRRIGAQSASDFWPTEYLP